MPGGRDLLVEARAALLDALEALQEQRTAVVLVGAQAIYFHTGGADVALAEATKDSDLALDARLLADEPRVEEAMFSAGFRQDSQDPQPGAWISPTGIPVDLMVPEALAGGSGRRSANIPPHGRSAVRRAVGLEASVVDHASMLVEALAADDARRYTVNVAGPAALLVAKLHKVGERRDDPRRLEDKDAHDLYRLLVAVPTDVLSMALVRLQGHPLAGAVTEKALAHLLELFSRPDALGAVMAGRAEEGVGEPRTVSASTAVLTQDLLESLGIALA